MQSFMNELTRLKIQYEDLKLATKTFDNTQIIGHGGFGKVYWGNLSCFNGRRVAIKCLDPSFGQGGTEFWKEITVLIRHTHENLITLLGFCTEGNEMILVYDYASKGSLDRHLSSTNFTWAQRLKTCLGAARGLSFLHDTKGTNERVIHCDIKSANILLDENWNAKVSDMGLSKIAPANQLHTGLFTSPAGSIGYIDPSYIDNYYLTKESDVYSFGVVLFEVLCGRLCFERKSNGQFQVFVSMWKASYEQNKLQEIILKDLKQQMDQMSLKTYSDIAYKCLHNSHNKRPTMPQVVEELKTALTYQELYERMQLRRDYKKMLLSAADPRNAISESKLKMLLLKGILINNNNTWFSLDINGDHCEMISIAACLTSTARETQQYIRLPGYTERFAVGCSEPLGAEFKAHVRTQFLSPQITYTINLVFKRRRSKEQYVGLEYKLEGEEERCYSFISDEREDGWLTAELCQFTSDRSTVDLEILFYIEHCENLLVESIEFRPVEHEVDDRVFIQPISDRQQCLVLPAKAVLKENQWKSETQSRFGEVAKCISEKVDIFCEFSSEMLSPQTTYATYLVYGGVPNDYTYVNPPLQVVDINSGSDEESNIFLCTPETPIISGNLKTTGTYKPSIRPMIKGLTKQRSDGWMEVQVHEFKTLANIEMISKHLRLSSHDMSLAGITVQGLEFRPI